YNYRTKDGVEVDAVIETPDGRVIGVEVKAGATVRAEDLTGLRSLAIILGERFVAGYVLYTGQQTLPFGEKLRAVPRAARRRRAPGGARRDRGPAGRTWTCGCRPTRRPAATRRC